VIAPDVGGSFGGKASIYPEDVVVAFAALRIGSTVKWCATRSEDFLSATQGRGGLLEGWLAVSDDGRFTALRAEAAFPLGYWLPYSAQVPARNAGRILPGPYLIQNVDISVRGDVTADAPVNIYRGAGRPEATMLMERLADAAARATGMDPVDIRFKNLIAARQLPYQTPTGERLDAGDYPALLTTVCAMSNYVRLRKGESRRKRDSKLRGQGIAVYVEPCGAGWESAFVGLDHLGRIVAGTGSTSQGQGRETAAAQIVAADLAWRRSRSSFTMAIRHRRPMVSVRSPAARRRSAAALCWRLPGNSRSGREARPRTCCRQASNASNGIQPASRFGETESSWFAGAI